MIKAILKFKSLVALAAYAKEMKFDTFILNTDKLTLMSVFNEMQFAIAIEEYNATILSKTDIVQ